jgi:hypothetical protein
MHTVSVSRLLPRHPDPIRSHNYSPHASPQSLHNYVPYKSSSSFPTLLNISISHRIYACMHVICVDSSGAEAVLRLSVTPLPRVLPSVETGLSATCVRVGPDRTQDLFALRFLPAGS